MDKPATLIILTPGFAADETDSSCLPLQQSFVRSLKKAEPDTNIIVLSFQYPFQRADYNWYGVQVKSFGGRNKNGLMRRLTWYRVWRKLVQLNKETAITGIMSFWCGEAALIGKRFADRHNLIHKCWVLGQDATKQNHYVRRIRPQAGELLALSDFIQSAFEVNHGIKPAFILPPGIDTAYFSKHHYVKDIDLLAAGSLIPLKQYNVFLEVIAMIYKEKPGIRAMLCGSGPEMANLLKQVKRLRLEEIVTLTDALPHQVVLQFMQRARVFLHTSGYEGFGVVCIEALYAGAKVISFVKPMRKDIQNWHIASDSQAMVVQAIQWLDQPCSTEQVLPYRIEDIVEMMRRFYGRKN